MQSFLDANYNEFLPLLLDLQVDPFFLLENGLNISLQNKYMIAPVCCCIWEYRHKSWHVMSNNVLSIGLLTLSSVQLIFVHRMKIKQRLQHVISHISQTARVEYICNIFQNTLLH